MNYTYWEDGKLFTVDRKDVADMMRSMIRGEMYDRVKTGECVCPDFKLCRDDCSHCRYCCHGIIESTDMPVENDEEEEFFSEIVDKHASVEDQVIWKICVENAYDYLEKKEKGLGKVFLMLISGYRKQEIADIIHTNWDGVRLRTKRITEALTPVRDEIFGF